MGADRMRQIVDLLEGEIGAWLDAHASTVAGALGDRKAYFLLCGSAVEGFAAAGSDLDLALVVEDDRALYVRDRALRGTYRAFLGGLDQKVRSQLGLSHVCGMARTIRTTLWLKKFDRARNPHFRVNYFLFSRLLHPKVKDSSIRELLATERDLRRLKLDVLRAYDGLYGGVPPIPKIDERALADPAGRTPKSVYRQVQLCVNGFIAAYGLSSLSLLRRSGADLRGKLKMVLRTVLSKDAFDVVYKSLDPDGTLSLLAELRARCPKRKRIGKCAEPDEIERVERLTQLMLRYVGDPLRDFYRVHRLVIRSLLELGYEIAFVGLRRDHAYVALDNHPTVQCLDIFKESGDGGGDIYCVYYVPKGRARDKAVSQCRASDILVEVRGTENIIGVGIPVKKHVPVGGGTMGNRGLVRRRVHIRLGCFSPTDPLQKIEEILRPILPKRPDSN